jgi:arginase
MKMKKKKHLNLLMPQWQGGGPDKSTYFGGMEIRDKYMQGMALSEVQISTEDSCQIKNNIFGYDCIYNQLKQAKHIVESFSPDTIFTIGGGCDADIIPITYLNKRYNKDLTVLWFDAHADLHTPETTETRLLYGMPLRLAMGEGDRDILELLWSNIRKSQLIMLGTRDIDRAEEKYINENSINILTCPEIESDIDKVISRVKSLGNEKIYIHIDLDVIEPAEFPHVPITAKDGLSIDVFETLISELHRSFEIVGLGLYEYNGTAKNKNRTIENLVFIGNSM